MKNILYLIVIALLSVMNIFLLLRSERSKSVEANTGVDPYSIKLMDHEGELLLTNARHEIANEGYKVKSAMIQECANGTAPAKLIFRFSDLGCSSCIEAQLEMVVKYQDELGPRNIAVFGSVASLRDTAFYKGWNDLKCQTHFIEYESVGLPIEKFNMPYYFVITDESVAQVLHVPSKELPLLTDLYLSAIGRRFFEPEGAYPTPNQ